MLEFVFIIVLVAVLVMLVMQWRGGRGGKGLSQAAAAQYVQGTFTVTGVSERPAETDKNGDSYCTISGTITGPQTNPTEVYGTLVIGALGSWPHHGSDMPVIYKPGKAETTWRFGTLEEPSA
ncbi:hypothetical protein M2359_003750 [Gordonia amarae]|uniref:Uncharacterized protein n=1 Tax=Gordonia amarae NBRC 15530 TaxID=1075090 RepID=G7GT28_9ACTN|nr:hypothetical protein [Gordonia amarae]MCS3880121.1 hypothetical protein [Gordonia amarae]GAB06753.1 hypothetical protein GOAMR_59_00540 [Gordonia amarae NBRC 15530]